MESDYSVFSILPPYNAIEAQLIVGGKLLTNGSGYTVAYQAVADADGSVNSTSRDKGNFINSAFALFGHHWPWAKDCLCGTGNILDSRYGQHAPRDKVRKQLPLDRGVRHPHHTLR